jgi:hypothetical protein
VICGFGFAIAIAIAIAIAGRLIAKKSAKKHQFCDYF